MRRRHSTTTSCTERPPGLSEHPYYNHPTLFTFPHSLPFLVGVPAVLAGSQNGPPTPASEEEHEDAIPITASARPTRLPHFKSEKIKQRMVPGYKMTTAKI
ncbi:hypothetical protein MRX96_026019 [Rhipicephalus microplus]